MIEAPKDNVVDADNGAEDPSDRDLELSKLLAEYFQRQGSFEAVQWRPIVLTIFRKHQPCKKNKLTIY